jgi:hypothetical protein
MATSPVFDGLTLTGFTGLLKAVAGVVTGSAGVADMPFAIKYGTTTHDISLTGGSAVQPIVGVGFKPTVVLFASAILGGGSVYIGIDDGTNPFSVGSRATSYAVASASYWQTASISVITGNGVHAEATITALGTDGFTLTWTKTGSPTGTATVMYLAIKA